jgi:hypothetical protein
MLRDAQLTLKEAQKKAGKERAKKRKRGEKGGACASTTGETNKRKRGEEPLQPVVECNTFALDEIAWVASQVVGRELFVQYASVKVITGTSDLRRLRLVRTQNRKTCVFTCVRRGRVPDAAPGLVT